MRLLLDTHIFLWFITGNTQLAPIYREAIQNPANESYLSVVSLWEIIIKHQLGKLPLPDSPEAYIPMQRVAHQIASLPIDEASVAQVTLLPPLHRDPFDRLLIGQPVRHGLIVVTIDAAILAYPGIAVL